MTLSKIVLAIGSLLLGVMIVLSAPAQAQTSAEFYAGKTVQFMVGYPPSGAFDAYTRVAARFIGKHILGNPTVIVQNMPGASSLQFVRYLQDQAPKDGTQFGMFNRGLMPKSVLEPKETGVDFTKFAWIGSMNSELAICYMWAASGIASINDLKKRSFTLGDTSKNSGGYLYTSILRSFAPEQAKLVLGYSTTGHIWLAIERGEVDGNCTLVTSLESQKPEWLTQKKVNTLVQFAESKHKDLPDVPTIFELLQDQTQKQAINFLIASEAIGRPIIGPPGLRNDRLVTLRKAFDDMMKDPEFLEHARKAKMDMDPVPGEKAAAIAAAIQNTPAVAVEVARKFME